MKKLLFLIIGLSIILFTGCNIYFEPFFKYNILNSEGTIVPQEFTEIYVGVGSSIEMAIPKENFGGFIFKHFEPIFFDEYGSELDYTGSLTGDFNLLLNTTINIDGNLDDWNSISPFRIDPSFDENISIQGADLTNLYLCRDDFNLYCRFDLQDNSPNITSTYTFYIGDSPGFPGGIGYTVYHNGTTWDGRIDL